MSIEIASLIKLLIVGVIVGFIVAIMLYLLLLLVSRVFPGLADPRAREIATGLGVLVTLLYWLSALT